MGNGERAGGREGVGKYIILYFGMILIGHIVGREVVTSQPPLLLYVPRIKKEC